MNCTTSIRSEVGLCATDRGILNALTVDVEEHFQVSAFETVVSRENWEAIPSRVEPNTLRLLDLLDKAGVRGTFFVLGWVAERHRGLVRRIADRGHEIGCHGYGHRLIWDQTPETFREELGRALRTLQDISGQSVPGYRAPSFSVVRRTLWALDVIAETGFSYDSSVFPIRHDRYGMPGALRAVHRLRTPVGNRLVEAPPSTVQFGNAILPVAGGGYLRLYPAWITHWAIRRLNRAEAQPAIVYVHPWEVDPSQPRVQGAPLRSKLRHYTNLRTTAGKLRGLCARHRFGPLREVIERLGPLPEIELR